jgi:WD40 repeat protein
MSRWLLALVAFGFSLAPVCSADPKPLWEIETFPNAKKPHDVRWVGYSLDGKMLIAQVDENMDRDDYGDSTSRLFVWDVETRKEQQNLKLGKQTSGGDPMHANATTKTGSVLIAGRPSEEVRLADGARVASKEVDWSVGVWLNADSSDSLWLCRQGFDYQLSYGKMPLFALAGKKEPVRERWVTTKLGGDWSEAPPVVAASSDLTRLILYPRSDHKLALYNVAVGDTLKLTEVATVPAAHKAAITTQRFSPDGKIFVTGSRDTSVCLWDVEKAGKDWKPRATISAGPFTPVALAFSPDGHALAVGTTADKGLANLFLIDPKAGKLLASYRLDGTVMTLAYSPDGKTLVTGDSKGRIKTWNAGALRNPD